jgi:hypothetical protein
MKEKANCTCEINTCGQHEAMSIVSPWGPRMPICNSESVLITPATFGQNSVLQFQTQSIERKFLYKMKNHISSTPD